MELCIGICGAASDPEYQLEAVHGIRSLQRYGLRPHVPHRARNQGQDTRRDGRRV